MEFKDYYAILGVAKAANADEIRKAFRSLARKYHPDVAKDKKTAEEKFKEINEAYEVLGDAEKRRKYDELGSAWQQGNAQSSAGGRRTRSRSRGGPGQGMPDGHEFHFGGTGFSDFFEEFFGARQPWAAGEGFEPGTDASRGRDVEADLLVTLEEAQSGGTRQVSLRWSEGCPNCEGAGQTEQGPCKPCSGTGRRQVVRQFQVRIPAGIREGQKLKVSGKGGEGVGSGNAGDLYLRLKFARHPDFRIEGNTLYHDLDLAPWEAVLGCTLSVPTLSEPVRIKVPPGAQEGQQMRLRGAGMASQDGSKGDLHVVLHLVLPTTLSSEERGHWENLGKVSTFKPRG